MDFEYLIFTAFLLPGLVVGITFHEAAHAISAKWLGDRTAESMGRVSLNPLRHLSLLGTLSLFVLRFGWGKPVVVNIYNFKKPKFHYLLSSLAGPATNIILSAIALGILYLPLPSILGPVKLLCLLGPVKLICLSIYYINAVLAVINLLPVPPLDGSKIWPCIIPGMKPAITGKWNMVWMVVLIGALYTGVIGKIMDPVRNFLDSLLPTVLS